jgi:hypothetical protein
VGRGEQAGRAALPGYAVAISLDVARLTRDLDGYAFANGVRSGVNGAHQPSSLTASPTTAVET